MTASARELDERDAGEVARVREWSYYPAYGRRMHVELHDGSQYWVSMGSALASALYRVGELPPVAECVDCGVTVSTEGACNECAPWSSQTSLRCATD